MNKNEIISLLLESKIATTNEIRGVTEVEIEQCEIAVGLPFPQQYREFLLAIGRQAGMLFQGTDILSLHAKDLLELRQEAEALLVENRESFEFPTDALVFSMHQGYEFTYILISEGDDPPVYQYVEGNGPPVLVWKSFSFFLKESILHGNFEGIYFET